jgi:phospholipid/cholesterol/gamma-HCH transport system substrate-binding protein
MESKGGVGAQYFLWDDHINFLLEAHDFTSNNNPNLKAGVDFTFLEHFMLSTGVDDFINQYDDPHFFVGAGLRVTDDDLSAIFTRVPLPDY